MHKILHYDRRNHFKWCARINTCMVSSRDTMIIIGTSEYDTRGTFPVPVIHMFIGAFCLLYCITRININKVLNSVCIILLKPIFIFASEFAFKSMKPIFKHSNMYTVTVSWWSVTLLLLLLPKVLIKRQIIHNNAFVGTSCLGLQ